MRDHEEEETNATTAQKTWRDVANEYLPEGVTKAIAEHDPARFKLLIRKLKKTHSLQKLSTDPEEELELEDEEEEEKMVVHDVTALLRSHLNSKPYRVDVEEVVRELIEHCLTIALADNKEKIDLKIRTKWALLLIKTLETYEGEIDGLVEIEWERIYERVSEISKGVSEYYGPVVLAEWRSAASALTRASRRYFKLGSSEQIWLKVRTSLEDVWSEECFTSLAFLCAFLPTRVLRNRKGNEEDVRFYKRMIEGDSSDWNRLFDALPSSMFWKSGFLQLFSQCAKHDVAGNIEWPQSLDAKIYSASLWSFQLSSSSNANKRGTSKQMEHLQIMASSVRSIGSPATKIAPRVLDTEHRSRSIAKFIVFRSINYASSSSTATTTTNITNVHNNRDRLFEFLEHNYIPDSPSSSSLAWFLGHFVSYLGKAKSRSEMEETVGSGIFTSKQDEELTNMALIANRLCSDAVLSKHPHTKKVAIKAIATLCYICPKHTIYDALKRFENTLQNDDSSHQIATAIEALALVTRSMLINIDPSEIFSTPEQHATTNNNQMELDEYEGYSTGAFVVSALEATLPCIDVNDAEKLNAALKFYTILLSSVSNLIDAGEKNCVPQLPVVWSEWTLEVLDRVFTVIEHAQPEAQSTSLDSSESSGSFLMNSNCMYTPMFRTLLIRLPEDSRKSAIGKIARFIFTNTLSSATRELGVLVSSCLIASPDETIKEIIDPLFDMLSVELNEAQLDAKRTGELSKARINRLSYIVGVLSLGFDRAHTKSLARLKEKVVQSCRRLFALAESARSNPVLFIAGPLLCRYCLALGNFIDQLDAQQAVTQDEEAIRIGKRIYSDWVALKWKVSKEDDSFGPPDIESRKKLCLPKPFNWASEEDHEIKNTILREIIEEFLQKASLELSELFEGCAVNAIQNMDINEGVSSDANLSMSPKSTSQMNISGGGALTATLESSSPERSIMRKRQSLAEIAKVSKIGSIGQFASINDMEDYNCRRHRVRSLAAKIGAVATGLTARIPDFNDDSNSQDLAIHGEMPGSLVFDLQTRRLAADALSLALENHESDDAVTLTIVARVAEEILSPSNSTYHAAKAAMRSWIEDASYLTMPHPSRKKKNVCLGEKIPELYPRWLVYEYARIKHHWRRAQAVYFRESSGEYCRENAQNASCVRLFAALRSCAINNTYVSVRAAARSAIETDLERYQKEAPRIVDASAESLMIPEENEDRCRAACEVLKTNSSIIATTQTSSESLLKFAYALLRARCVHDTIISQQAISEAFVNFAARFSRRSMDLLNYSVDGPTELMDDLVKFIFQPPDDRAKHWSFQSMAITFFMFTLVSDCSEKSVRNATKVFLEGLTSEHRPTWIPSACGLLLISRFTNFDEKLLVEAVNANFENAKELSEKLLFSFASARGEDNNRDIGERGGGHQSRSAILAQAGESLYGLANELAAPFPQVNTRAMEGINTTPGVFITVFARVWEMLFKARPNLLRKTVDDIIESIDAHDTLSLSSETTTTSLSAGSAKKKPNERDGGSISPSRRKKPLHLTAASASINESIAATPVLDNTALSARAEAIAAAVRLCDKKATDLLVRKTRGNTSDISRETWLRALAFSIAERSNTEHFSQIFEQMIEELPLTSASMLSQIRRLESISIFIAESARYSLGEHVEYKVKMIEELLDIDGESASSPFIADSQGVRNSGAHVAAKLVSLNRNAHRNTAVDMNESEAKIRESLDSFIIDSLTPRVNAQTEMVIEGDIKNDPMADGDAEPSEDVKKARRFLESVFTFTKLLILMGDVTSIADFLPVVLRSALLCAENTSDIQFGLEAKSVLIALRSVLYQSGGVGNNNNLDVIIQTIIDSSKSSYWKTRKQSALFASAFAFRHMFVLEDAQTDALQDCVVTLLADSKVEVRECAQESLFAFLSSSKRREKFALDCEASFDVLFIKPAKSIAKLAQDSESIRNRHAVALALAAIMHSSANPIDPPECIKRTIVLCAKCALDSDPIKDCSRKAFAEQKKKLHDKEKFDEFKRKFSERDWDSVSLGFDFAPSYMV